MPTFAEDIERALDDPPEWAVIGEMGWHGYEKDERHAPGLQRKGELLSWETARPLLDYEYSNGYGAPDCHAVWVWTSTRVAWVTQYDGSTAVDSAPRSPVAGLPDMPGG